VAEISEKDIKEAFNMTRISERYWIKKISGGKISEKIFIIYLGYLFGSADILEPPTVNQREMLKVQIAVRVLLSLKAIYLREREKTAKETELKDTDKRQNAKFNF
jgi:hypothetical protein